MNTSDAGLALIRRFEGFSARPYLCPSRILTIGYGHVITPAEYSVPMVISEARAMELLMADVAVAEKAVAHYISIALNQNQFDALVSFTYNLGSGVLQRATLRRAINRGEASAIAYQWKRWVWGGGRKLPGLVARRAAELALFQQ